MIKSISYQVVEPQVTVILTSNITDGVKDTAALFTAVITHTSLSAVSAYNVTMSIVLSHYFFLPVVSNDVPTATHSEGLFVAQTTSSATQTLTVTADYLGVGENITLHFAANIRDYFYPGDIALSTATVVWGSNPATLGTTTTKFTTNLHYCYSYYDQKTTTTRRTNYQLPQK